MQERKQSATELPNVFRMWLNHETSVANTDFFHYLIVLFFSSLNELEKCLTKEDIKDWLFAQSDLEEITAS